MGSRVEEISKKFAISSSYKYSLTKLGMKDTVSDHIDQRIDSVHLGILLKALAETNIKKTLTWFYVGSE